MIDLLSTGMPHPSKAVKAGQHAGGDSAARYRSASLPYAKPDMQKRLCSLLLFFYTEKHLSNAVFPKKRIFFMQIPAYTFPWIPCFFCCCASEL